MSVKTIDISHGLDARLGIEVSESDFLVLLDIVECACETHPGFKAWRRIFDELYGFYPLERVNPKIPLDNEYSWPSDPK